MIFTSYLPYSSSIQFLAVLRRSVAQSEAEADQRGGIVELPHGCIIGQDSVRSSVAAFTGHSDRPLPLPSAERCCNRPTD